MNPSALTSQIPEDALAICRRISERGYKAWIVGGCVRDLLRGAPAKDWDIATSALPETIVQSFRKVIPTGIQHGTVTVVSRGEHYEVTTLRGEGAYSDGRRPDSVSFVSDIELDLARRDFTFNAIAFDPIEEKIIDPFGGIDDLRRRVVRAVGVAKERFSEDGLRILRGARFAATLECAVDPETERAMGDPACLDTYRKVSPERIRDEWLKSMRASRPSVSFDLMQKCGALAITCPEMGESVGCEQNRYHAYDVWGHAMACLDACDGDPILRIAALMHDIGKPRSRAFSEKTNDYTFYEHERIGAEMADPIAARLKFSNEERTRIVGLVRHHLICYTPDWSDAAVRRWLRRVSPELASDLYRLGAADADGKGRDASEDKQNIADLEARVASILAANNALSTRDLAIGGRDLITDLGIRPGPVIGRILEHLLEVVTDTPEKNERDALLAEAREFEKNDVTK